MERKIKLIGRQHINGLVLVTVVTTIAYLVSQQFSVVSSLTVGLVIALLVSNLFRLPDSITPGAVFASKYLMRLGIILLGLRISFNQVAEVGFAGLILVVIVVVGTFFGVIVLGKVLNLSKNTSILLGAGFAICGNTAIAAISPTINAKREETAYAVGLVTLFGTISIGALPLFASLLGLSEQRFGAWAGAAVHDVGQVVATAEVIGGAALTIAVIVKLTRMLLLAPMLIAISAKFNVAAGAKMRAAIPPFILLFIGVLSLNSLLTIPVQVIDMGKTVSILLLTAGITGMGMGVKWRNLITVGGNPLIAATIAWVLIATGSLGLIVALGVA
ncbi:MAG: putative sulfate exporter family transporter [Actinobacteria bacterium]|nr:putative sulfate exporter family transporter [Actinomycetota bacterium]